MFMAELEELKKLEIRVITGPLYAFKTYLGTM